MKTFKLKMLEVLLEEDMKKDIPLLDGLIIDREDEHNFWLIEAYMDQCYYDYFHELQEQTKEFLVRVKITKETNDPATFNTTIVGLNRIGENMNVLLQGIIISD